MFESNAFSKRFLALKPLSRIYVGFLVIVIWPVVAVAAGRLIACIVVLGILVAAAPIERAVMSLVARVRRPEQSGEN